MKKNKDGRSAYVYSTDPEFQYGENRQDEATLSPAEQQLKVSLETKHRAGKTVTLIKGFIGKEEDLADLGKLLKGHCGTGGAAKDGEIILQGDHREKVKSWLKSHGYPAK
jgi:translation initiation factor 1